MKEVLKKCLLPTTDNESEEISEYVLTIHNMYPTANNESTTPDLLYN